MAEYCDCKECGYLGYSSKKSLGDKIGERYMGHAGGTVSNCYSDFKEDKPRLATDAVDEKPEQWNTEWDNAYNLGVQHGEQRERRKWIEKLESWLREKAEW